MKVIVMIKLLKSFRKDTRGATSIEYALVAVVISIAGIVAMEALGGAVSNIYNGNAKSVTAVMPGGT